MNKEFKFVVWEEEYWTVYRAIEVVETGIYRVEWNKEDGSVNFTHYLPEHVENYLNNGDWIVVG